MQRKDEELQKLQHELEAAQSQMNDDRAEMESLRREKRALRELQSLVRGCVSANFFLLTWRALSVASSLVCACALRLAADFARGFCAGSE